MTEHTPGPWRTSSSKTHRICTEDGGAVIAHATMPPHRMRKGAWQKAAEVARANAHLIAAAPDLLEALADIERDWDGEPEDMFRARAALSKARGVTA